VPSIDECPDGVFIEDTMVVYGDLAVIARSGAEQRRPEAAAAARTVAEQGYRVTHLTAPGTLDGGDILKIGSTVYVGEGGRTNDEGIRQLSDALAPLGADVRAVPVRKVLHLKSAVTALPDGTVIGYEPLVDEPAAFDHFRPVPEESGSHVVLLGEDRLLMAASAPRSAELFERLGYTPVVVDISEFEKLEGCVTCLSVRLRR
jgi:dimethylargininase